VTARRYRIGAAKAPIFYRAGRGWPAAGVVVERSAFSDADWARLLAETMLSVEPVAETAAQDDAVIALRVRIRDVFPQLEAADFNRNGTPKVSAVERLLPEDERAITGKLVAEVWADVKAGP